MSLQAIAGTADARRHPVEPALPGPVLTQPTPLPALPGQATPAVLGDGASAARAAGPVPPTTSPLAP